MNAHTADLLDLEPAPSTKAEDTSSKIAAAEMVAALTGGNASDEFDWASDDSVVLREQLQVAIYRNRFDAIVLRQEGVSRDEDQFVVLRDHEAVRRVVAGLQRELKEVR